ncbi:hypothetical protein BEL04_05805 [Mucilaginibacter sp. PPCGB 2223]|uniref:DUF6526 family protein n=1 Tax=Mucilaginibacter sp. PPCGB 2223 TaxID=1886027 RepID=UPI00082573BA|nr:DUF6526 family protein [Mucilaginibacter sp. PPCGB 2223]OCX53800.1 hypothetical protein BEL04_05805 [Mucilaginibacter sp. PPCGB 2223]
MEPQNYANHARYVRGYHFLLGLLLFAGLLISAVNLARHWNVKGFVSAAMIVLLYVCCGLMYWYLRRFPLKAQDRAIRAEESLRYYILTGKAIDKRLTMAQIISLRFASDEEYIDLAERAASENLSPKEIKKAIKNWRADHHRA